MMAAAPVAGHAPTLKAVSTGSVSLNVLRIATVKPAAIMVAGMYAGYANQTSSVQMDNVSRAVLPTATEKPVERMAAETCAVSVSQILSA